jgi:FkbM family methyltransferase
MSERSPDSSIVQSVHVHPKRIPGLIRIVRHMRALLHTWVIAVITRAMVWGTKRRAGRLLVFEALPERLALALHPQESYVVNASDKVIGRSIYVNGQFDFQKFETACHLIQMHAGLEQEAILIDAGANIGSICIPAVKRGLVARAIAFELDPENVRLLRINAILNGVDDRIEILNTAVGAAPGQVSIQHSPSNFGDHRVQVVDRGRALAADMSIAMVDLDSIADDLDLSRTILWMDIQGFEAFALQGAQRYVSVGVPLIAEFSREELESTGSFDTFLSLIVASGYAVFFDLNAPQPTAVPVNRKTLLALSDRLVKQNTFTDLLFLPASTA